MKKLLLVGFAIALMASAAYANFTVSYGWEDGVGTTLGHYSGSTTVDNVPYELNVMGMVVGQACTLSTPYVCPGAYEGTHYLQTAESPHAGTPQIYLACITNLVAGDQVTASFWGYDPTPSGSPSLRIWAHYTDSQQCPDCPGNYTHSASGPADYTTGTGWSQLSYTWTYTPNAGDGGLVIEARLYSSPSTMDPCTTDYFIDLVSVTAPDNAHVLFPDLTGPSAADETNWGGIKALFK
jgi:hypothetical protein